MSKTRTANLTLVVKNLVQRFWKSGTETISWFIAEGELVQFDKNFNELERSQMRHRMLRDDVIELLGWSADGPERRSNCG